MSDQTGILSPDQPSVPVTGILANQQQSPGSQQGIMSQVAPPGPALPAGAVPITGSNTPYNPDTNTSTTPTLSNPSKVPTQAYDPNAQTTGLQSYQTSTGATGVGLATTSGQVETAPAFQFGGTPSPITPNVPLSSLPNTNVATPATPPNPASTAPLGVSTLQQVLTTAGVAYGVANDLLGSGASAGAAGTGISGGINSALTSALPGSSLLPAGTTALGALSAGSVGGTIASLLGLGSDSWLANTGASLAGGYVGAIAAGAIGTDLGVSLGSVGGPIGAIIGGFLGTVLAGVFGGKPSEEAAWGTWTPGQSTPTNAGSQTGDKYNATNNAAVTALVSNAATLSSSISNTFGASLNDYTPGANGAPNTGIGNIAISVDSRHGITVAVNGGLANYDDPSSQNNAQNNWVSQVFSGANAGVDAMNFIGVQQLKNTTFKNPDTQAVASNTDWSTISFNQAVGNLNFAQNFNTDATAMIKGTMTVDTNPATAKSTISAWQDTAHTLFSNDPSALALADQAANSMYSRISLQNPSS